MTFRSVAQWDFIRWIVRGCGLLVLLVGMVVLLKVVKEALILYEDPTRIETLAVRIENAANLDVNLSPASPRQNTPALTQTQTPTQTPTPTRSDDTGPGAAAPAATPPPAAPRMTKPGLRLSYFVAWIIELLLLLLIARIGLAAIKTGGELVLYRDEQPARDKNPEQAAGGRRGVNPP